MRKPQLLIFFLFFLVSLFLYFYRFPKMLSFDADQEYYANQYLQIVKDHKFTLLGIETSIGGMFVGPVYTYFSSFVYWLFSGNPLGMFWVTLLFTSFQASLTYYLFTKLKNQKVGLVAGILVLFSASLWNKAFAPSLINFLYPMGLFFFYTLIRSKKAKKYFVYLGLLLALTIHIHFSLLFFFPITVAFLLWQKLIKRENIKEFMKIFILIFLAKLPLLIFDLRHQFFISRNFIQFVAGRFTQANDHSLSPIDHFYWLTRGLAELFANTLVSKPNIFVYIFLVGVFIFYLKNIKKDFNYRVIALMYTITFVLFFLYRSPVPDYYWYFLLAPFFFVVSDFLAVLLQNKLWKYAVYAIILTLAILNLQFMNSTLNHYNFSLKQQVARYIKNQSQGRKVKISYDTDLGLGFGFDYLLKYEGVNIDNNNFAENYHIVIRSYGNYPGVEFREPGSPVSIKVVKLARYAQ